LTIYANSCVVIKYANSLPIDEGASEVFINHLKIGG
jgi:hypothetical protein